MRSTALRAAALVATSALAAGCGEDSPPEPQATDLVPVTARAVAAIALDHVDPGVSTLRDARLERDRGYPDGAVGAQLRWEEDDEHETTGLGVAVMPDDVEIECDDDCVELDTDVPGASLVLIWDDPVEDEPGFARVVLVHDGEIATAGLSGLPAAGDPREQDLQVGVEEMVAVVEDPRLRLMTTPAVIAAGEALDDWQRRPDV